MATVQMNKEDDDLDFTQKLRRDLVKNLTTDELGKPYIPKEKDNVTFLLATLDGMDRQAIGKLRIRKDESTGAGLAIALASEILRSVTGGKVATPLAGAISDVSDAEFQMSEDLAIEHDKVVDERQLAYGTQHDTYDDFMKRISEGEPDK